jgi:lysyl-tRNA synthetase class 1
MFGKPKAAKRLYFDVIPRAVDEYRGWVVKAKQNTPAELFENPAWHIHQGRIPKPDSDLSFSMLLNLASVCNATDKAVLWGFISRYDPHARPETAPMLDGLVGYALAYYRDFVRPRKHYRRATPQEHAAIAELREALLALPQDADAEELQNSVYEIGKRHGFENLRDWFRALYEVLLGQSEGPRMGSFIALYGRAESIALIDAALAGELTPTAQAV